MRFQDAGPDSDSDSGLEDLFSGRPVGLKTRDLRPTYFGEFLSPGVQAMAGNAFRPLLTEALQVCA